MNKLIKKPPLVSILMAVYNTPLIYLNKAISGIINQEFSDFELIIIDDCSEKFIKNSLEDWIKKDKRVIVKSLVNNLGLTKALNYGLNYCNGKYIARHDADDFSKPERIKKQFKFLEKNPGFCAVGSYSTLIDENENIIGYHNYSFDSKKIFKFNHLVHGSMMFKKEIISKLDGYDERLKLSQDYGLYLKMIKLFDGKIFVIEEHLYELRIHSKSLSQRKKFKQLYYATLAKRLSNNNINEKNYMFKNLIKSLYNLIFLHYFFFGPNLKILLNKLKTFFKLK